MATLRAIFGELRPFLQAAEDGELMDPQAIRDTFESLSYPLEQKLDNYIEFAGSLLRDAEAFDAEAERCKAKAASLRKNAEYLKNTAAFYVDQVPDRKLKTQYHSFGYKANGGKMPLEYDADKVPKKYLILTPKVDTNAIREVLDSGKKLKWARYAERGEHFEWR